MNIMNKYLFIIKTINLTITFFIEQIFMYRKYFIATIKTNIC